MKQEYGRQIKRDEAEKIIDKRLKIVDKGNPVIKASVATKNDLIVQRFYDSGYNGFIFSEELVSRFFPDDDKLKGKRYLVVLLGAHPEDDELFKEGTPTVLLTGCTRQVKGKKVKFTTYSQPYPADEHPPQQFFPHFPSDIELNGKTSNTIEFELNTKENISNNSNPKK